MFVSFLRMRSVIIGNPVPGTAFDHVTFISIRIFCQKMAREIQGRVNRIQRYISYVLQFIIFAALISAIVRKQWITAFLALVILFLTFLPAVIEKNYKVFLPIEFELIIIIFVYSGLFLGELHSWYTRFWWWDVLLHGFSGVLLGLIGFIIMYILDSEKRLRLKMSPRFVALFAFVFAVAIGAIWEIAEFTLDSSFGTNMQRSGLVDTMWDLIVDVAGALFISIIGYLWIKTGKSLILNWTITKFVKENPHIFKEKSKRD